MVSEVWPLGEDREAAIGRARGAIRAGELVVFPTDTVYGIGCDAFNRDATASIFRVKRRPRSLPLPILVSRPRQAWALSHDPPSSAAELVAAFWPGPLTLVLPEAELDWDLGDAGGGVAVRMPDHPDALALLELVGPMAATSANITGEQTPSTVEGVRASLGDDVAVYLDGGPAAAEVGSTIVDLTTPAPTIVREGPITVEQIEGVLGAEIARA